MNANPSKYSSTAPLGARSVEKPRPLRSVNQYVSGSPNSTLSSRSSRRLSAQDISTVEDVVKLLESVVQGLEQKSYDEALVAQISKLNIALKSLGSQLELFYKDQFDKAQIVFRDSCKDGNLNLVGRLHLLEILELRGMNWVLNDNVLNYYKQKHQVIQSNKEPVFTHAANMMSRPSSLNVNAPDFNPTMTNFDYGNVGVGGNLLDKIFVAPGEAMATSGRYSRPTQPPGKSYFKDEVVIRNADSGKVAPGALERLVQITGPGVANVDNAKTLMEETIRRNQSPVPDEIDGKVGLNTVAEKINNMDNNNTSVLGEYKFTVHVGKNDSLKIIGDNPELVKIAKLVLDEYFEASSNSTQDDPKPIAKKDLKSYDRKFLFACAESPLCNENPPNWNKVAEDFPELLREVRGPRGNPTDQDLPICVAQFTNKNTTSSVRTKHQNYMNAHGPTGNPILDALRANMPQRSWDPVTEQWVEDIVH